MRDSTWGELLRAALGRPRLRRRRGGPLLTAPVAALESRQLLSAVPAGLEFRVNAHTTSNQQAPAVAMDADGDFVVVWISEGQDGSDFGIYGQRFNASGASQGSEFRVNVHTTNAQRDAAVAMDANGNFVVAWASRHQLSGSSDYDVFARRFGADGTPLSGEFQVNAYTTNVQRAPKVAMDADGDFVIVWHSNGQDGSNNGVYGQRYNATGTAQGTEFRINSYTTGSQVDPSIAMDAVGNFVVTWTSSGTSQAGANSGSDVYGQRYAADGSTVGSEFLVNSYTVREQTKSAVAMDADGDFVVTWVATDQLVFGSADDIYARRFSAGGVAQGTEFLVNTSTTGNQQAPAIAMDADGDFVIVWRSAHINTTNGDDVYAHQFAADGTPVGSQFRVNTHTSNQQFRSAVAMDADGDFVVVWDSYGQVNHPNLTSLYDIYAQRYEQPVTVGFTITQTGPGTSVSEHGTAAQKTDTFSVVLNTAPMSNVVLNVVSNDTTEATVNVATLTFTPGNWNVAQTVTVSGVFDNVADGNQMVTITVSVNDALSDSAYHTVADQQVSVTVLDVANRPVVNGPTGTGHPALPTFSWNDVAGETSYALWLINKTTGALVFQRSDIAADSTMYTLTEADVPGGLANGEYRFWINSVSANGYSQSGPHTDFTVGATITPPATPTGMNADFTGNPVRPEISWNNIAGATYSIYLIRLADSAVIASASGLTNPDFTPGVDLASGRHRIWVKAHNAAGSSAWSAPYDFDVGTPIVPPTAPTGFSVLNANTANPTVTWESQGAGVTYSIWFINLDTGAVVSGATGLTTNSFTASGLTTNRYRIWVKAHNAAGSSSWSSPFDFDVAVA
jgi:hypothetical protein